MYFSIDQAPSFSIGSILGGTSVSKSIVDEINSNMRSHTFLEGNSDFQFSDNSNRFIEEIVMPMKRSMIQIDNLKSKLNSAFVDQIRPLIDDEDYFNIPHCMMPMMISHPDVQSLMKQGRVSGFGIDMDLNEAFLPHYRIAYNGYVEDALENTKVNNGDLVLEYEFTSIDPDLSDDECSYLRDTFEKMAEMIDRNVDPTYYPDTIS